MTLFKPLAYIRDFVFALVFLYAMTNLVTDAYKLYKKEDAPIVRKAP